MRETRLGSGGESGKREWGDYSIFLGRLAVTEQSGRDTDTDRGF